MLTEPLNEKTDLIARLDVIKAKRSISISKLKGDDLHIVMSYAGSLIGIDEVCTEQVVTKRLAEWLNNGGVMLRADASQMRRALIDSGYWIRDGRGVAYKLSEKVLESSFFRKLVLFGQY